MSAMPEVVLPCDPGARPRRDGAKPGGDAAARPLRAFHPAAPRPSIPRSGTPRPRDTPAPPLRLTRRGRLVVAALAAFLVTVVSLLAAGAVQATNHAASPRTARQNLVQVVVRPGQSLWSVAESTDPDQDPRAVIQQIIDLNALASDVVFAGQQLWVPRG